MQAVLLLRATLLLTPTSYLRGSDILDCLTTFPVEETYSIFPPN